MDLLKFTFRKLMKKEERNPSQFSKYFQAVRPSEYSISCELHRTLANQDRRAPWNDRQVDVPFGPSHLLSSLSSDFQRKGRNSMLTVVARAYIRMTTAKGRRNGRRSVMRKLLRAIKSRVRRRHCKYHLFPCHYQHVRARARVRMLRN